MFLQEIELKNKLNYSEKGLIWVVQSHSGVHVVDGGGSGGNGAPLQTIVHFNKIIFP